MMSLEEFDSVVEKKYETIQASIDEEARKQREVCEAFAEAVINLLGTLLTDTTRYGEKEINLGISRELFGEYNVNQHSYADRSLIEIQPDQTVIKLTYAPFTRKRLPEEYDEHLVNELLSPYFITVKYNYDFGEEYDNGELRITYNRSKRLAHRNNQNKNGRTR